MAAKQSDVSKNNLNLATFAGGCFWCMEPVFKIYGVESAIVGYSGGNTPNPTYEQVGTGQGAHKEAIQLGFDPKQTPYSTLLKIFFQNIDPTDPNGQFADRGAHYQTAIFYHDENQKREAERALAELADSGKFEKPLAVKILPYKNFYPAEDYHQEYYKKNPARYQAYKTGSGRDEFKRKYWQEPH